MQRVLEECDQATGQLGVDTVHDLRVSLRRCRSIADGFMLIDPSPSWKEMKRAGGRLFRALGGLRDAHVMSGWVRQIGSEGDSETNLLLELLAEQEHQHKLLATKALRDFDVKLWQKWAHELPSHAARVRVGSLVFRHLALERWTEARDLHRQAIRNRSQVAFHRLRVGIKRFRYIVENFLPQQHAAWSSDLKELQDVLGEVHDLDVLWATARQVDSFRAVESRTKWQTIIQAKRAQRIARYRERMLGPKSLWSLWRGDLPQSDQIQTGASARLKLWASFLDPDTRHSQHVAGLARQVFDDLAKLSLASAEDYPNARGILVTAALLHDIGLANRNRGHHKESFRLIRKLTPPLGWNAEDLLFLAAIVRFHRGALPDAHHKSLLTLAPERYHALKLLAGILRFAEAFDGTHDGHVQRLQLEAKDGFLLVSAIGYVPLSPTGQLVASARHLLETVVRKPILVKPMRQPRA